jgi:Rrf2 family protein
VVSTRGARGGYRLGRGLAEISVAEVICAIDGPIALTSCVEGATGVCESQSLCPVAGRWDPVNEAIRAALSKITLADMAAAVVPKGLRLPPVSAPLNEVV